MKKTFLILFLFSLSAHSSELRITSKEEIIKEERDSFKHNQINRHSNENVNDSYTDRMRAFQEQRLKDVNRMNQGQVNIQIPLIWYAEKF